MKKTNAIVAAVAALFIIGAGGIFVLLSGDSTPEQTAQTELSTQQVQEPVEQKPEITISEDQKTISYQGIEGKTALEILESAADVSTEESSFGEFVTGINGMIADSDKNYWAFYVDGEYASEGAGTYVTSDGESIEWRLEDLEL